MDVFYSVIQLLAGLGAFLLGFKLLSDNIEKLATGKLRQLFDKTSRSKMAGVGIGILTTAIVQSSSVTTVMAVGLVNAGIMSLYQAATVIMGANIGTTITAQIVALQTFDFVQVAMCLTCVGAFMNMICKGNKSKTVGLALAGLGLVFMGLTFMSDSMQSFKESTAITDLLQSVTNPFLLLLIGVAVTAVVQSSSAVTSIIISMAGVGLVIGNGGNSVLYVILGTNIGTCVTAVLSSVGANTNAKRACLFHLLFNVLGAVIFMVVLLVFPTFNDVTFAKWFLYPSTQIAMFHTAFNVICTLIYLPFTKALVRLTEIIIPEKKAQSTDGFMDKRLLLTPSLAIGQLAKQTAHTADLAMESLNAAFAAFVAGDTGALDSVYANNDEVAETAKSITDYLIEVSAEDISLNDEKIINCLHRNVSDAVRIAELADNLAKYTKTKVSGKLHFSERVCADLKDMMALINEQYKTVAEILEKKDYVSIARSDDLENRIDDMRKRLTAEHIDRMKRGECNPENNNVFVNLVCNIERAGDHLSYMAHSIEEL